MSYIDDEELKIGDDEEEELDDPELDEGFIDDEDILDDDLLEDDMIDEDDEFNGLNELE